MIGGQRDQRAVHRQGQQEPALLAEGGQPGAQEKPQVPAAPEILGDDLPRQEILQRLEADPFGGRLGLEHFEEDAEILRPGIQKIKQEESGREAERHEGAAVAPGRQEQDEDDGDHRHAGRLGPDRQPAQDAGHDGVGHPAGPLVAVRGQDRPHEQDRQQALRLHQPVRQDDERQRRVHQGRKQRGPLRHPVGAGQAEQEHDAEEAQDDRHQTHHRQRPR
ncbi:MAG: hypothetical protein AAB249_00210, partial [Acidobacteriota bacterium]